MKKQYLLFQLIVVIIVIIVGFFIMPYISKKSSEKARLEREKILTMQFTGIIVDIPICHHCSRMLVKVKNDTIDLTNLSKNLMDNSNVGDSIYKLKVSNKVNIKQKNNNTWKTFKLFADFK